MNRFAWLAAAVAILIVPATAPAEEVCRSHGCDQQHGDGDTDVLPAA